MKTNKYIQNFYACIGCVVFFVIIYFYNKSLDFYYGDPMIYDIAMLLGVIVLILLAIHNYHLYKNPGQAIVEEKSNIQESKVITKTFNFLELLYFTGAILLSAFFSFLSGIPFPFLLVFVFIIAIWILFFLPKKNNKQ